MAKGRSKRERDGTDEAGIPEDKGGGPGVGSNLAAEGSRVYSRGCGECLTSEDGDGATTRAHWDEIRKKCEKPLAQK
ncbi:MAG: hypothetical protein LBD58_02035 [Treponema sp.]|nr:hypothetical protein [Treponema sp.]